MFSTGVTTSFERRSGLPPVLLVFAQRRRLAGAQTAGPFREAADDWTACRLVAQRVLLGAAGRRPLQLLLVLLDRVRPASNVRSSTVVPRVPASVIVSSGSNRFLFRRRVRVGDIAGSSLSSLHGSNSCRCSTACLHLNASGFFAAARHSVSFAAFRLARTRRWSCLWSAPLHRADKRRAVEPTLRAWPDRSQRRAVRSVT